MSQERTKKEIDAGMDKQREDGKLEKEIGRQSIQEIMENLKFHQIKEK